VYVVPGAAGAPSINVVVATAAGQAVTPLWSTAKTDAIGASVPQQLVIDLGDQPKVYDANDNPSSWMTLLLPARKCNPSPKVRNLLQ
jgi:hypothetical protein